MNILATSMASLVIVLGLAASALAEDAPGVAIERGFRKLIKGSLGQPVETRKIGFKTHHPQGMTAVDDRFFLSSVETIDRKNDQGAGHLFEMDREGALLSAIPLGEGALYHPGGIDYDGAHIWVPVAAYRPDSAAIMYVVDPHTLQSREMFRFNDHLGAAAHFPDKGLLIAVNWGARRFYRWKTEEQEGQWVVLNPDNPEMRPNGNHYMDYQDMQRIPGTPYLLCGGLQSYGLPESRLPSMRLGGMDLVHVEELRAHHQVPAPLRPPAAPAWTQNPFFVEPMKGGLRFFFIPQDNESTMYIFEVSTE